MKKSEKKLESISDRLFTNLKVDQIRVASGGGFVLTGHGIDVAWE